MYPTMRALSILPLLFCACLWSDQADDRAAIQKPIARFNDRNQRPSTLARNADLAPLNQTGELGVSAIYFEMQDVRFVTPDVAFVDAVASQYGSLILKRSMSAHFVLRREN